MYFAVRRIRGKTKNRKKPFPFGHSEGKKKGASDSKYWRESVYPKKKKRNIKGNRFQAKHEYFFFLAYGQGDGRACGMTPEFARGGGVVGWGPANEIGGKSVSGSEIRKFACRKESELGGAESTVEGP